MPMLTQTELTPRQHLLDSGYITAPILVSSRQRYGIEVIGPARGDVKWQANTEQGIDASQFHIDWERQQGSCPEGYTSISWTPAIDNRTNEVVKIKFSTKDCGRCPRQIHCIRSTKKYKRRTITIRPQAQYEALQAARRRQQTRAFASQYALREGIEATISESGCVPLACVAPAMSVLPKRICNILGLPLRLMWCVWWPGLMEMIWRPHASRLSRDFTSQFKGGPQQCQTGLRTRICVKFR